MTCVLSEIRRRPDGGRGNHSLRAGFPVLIARCRLDYFGFAYDSFKVQN
jgi:hypothetical protein